MLQLRAHIVYVIQQRFAASQRIHAKRFDDEFAFAVAQPGVHDANDQRDHSGVSESVDPEVHVTMMWGKSVSKDVFVSFVAKHLCKWRGRGPAKSCPLFHG